MAVLDQVDTRTADIILEYGPLIPLVMFPPVLLLSNHKPSIVLKASTVALIISVSMREQITSPTLLELKS